MRHMKKVSVVKAVEMWDCWTEFKADVYWAALEAWDCLDLSLSKEESKEE